MIFSTKRPLKFCIFFIAFYIICTSNLFAQKYTISGYVKDASSDETIIAANIAAGKSNGISNQYGFFSITLLAGTYQINTSHVGYRSTALKINLTKDTTLNISLISGTALSEEVVEIGRAHV